MIKKKDIDREVNQKRWRDILFEYLKKWIYKLSRKLFYLRLLLHVCDSFYFKSFFNTPKKKKHTCNLTSMKIYWSWFMKWLGDKFIFTSTCIAVQTILFTTSQSIYASVEATSYLQFLLLWNQNLLRDKWSHVLIIFISFSDRSDRGKILNNK